MNHDPESRPQVVPADPADPLDVLRRMHPWAQPVEMPRPVNDAFILRLR